MPKDMGWTVNGFLYQKADLKLTDVKRNNQRGEKPSCDSTSINTEFLFGFEFLAQRTLKWHPFSFKLCDGAATG